MSEPTPTAENDAPECDHPGIEHGPWSYTWVCPACHKCKFIGHGPLCGDCYEARIIPPAKPTTEAAR